MHSYKLVLDLKSSRKLTESDLSTIEGNITEHIFEEKRCDIQGFRKITEAKIQVVTTNDKKPGEA
jgi:hypothetical protein